MKKLPIIKCVVCGKEFTAKHPWKKGNSYNYPKYCSVRCRGKAERKKYKGKYSKRYRERHREKIRQYNQEYYQKHKEEIKKKRQKYWRERYLKMREKIIQRMREYTERNREKVREINRKAQARYRKTEKGRWSKRVYEYRKRNPKIGKIDKKQWEEKLKRLGGKCQMCGSTEDITIDHIIPLSKGGTNHIDNLQPLCRRCNSRKQNKIMKSRMKGESIPQVIGD